VSTVTHKGRHTTTAGRLYPLPSGGWIADTPGIRSLAVLADDEAVEEAFPEIAAAAQGCRFADCRHRQEPRCGVRAAVESGAISKARYDNYLRLKR
jgi:ribosome biogenesis GTPase